MTVSVADRVRHRLPRPISCDACGGPRVHLQKRSLMRMRVNKKWDLVWHCLDCLALVGCHEGTDIPLGMMADVQCREARFLAHRAFDRMWKGGGLTRARAYVWLAETLMLPAEEAHIGMLTEKQCETLIAAVKEYEQRKRNSRHWKHRKRKKRRT